ncbi:ABC transporter substrate-binding protein (plasmid) [Tistrella mobilis]|uniref:ABC transporter substrate-binding protein n=1 Tax=Tistrella mobilis TaxID=171437 RepID=UPI003556AD11
MKRLLAPLAAMAVLSGIGLSGVGGRVQAATYDPGASDDEIRIGMTVPLSGPASAYGIACAATRAFFARTNQDGGINGRKLTLLCEDDGFSPPRAIEQTRKLVESDKVLFLYNALGTSANTAVRPYLAARKVPQVLINSGASKWLAPAENPWVTTGLPQNRTEAVIFARHILETMPDARVGLLQQADDYGKDYVEGLREGFGPEADRHIVAIETFDLAYPTVDTQILNLKARNVDVVIIAALAKHAAQAIRKIGDLQWHPTVYLGWASTSIDYVLKPAGLDHAKGVISTAIAKHPDDPRWKDDAGVARYLDFMKTWFPSGEVTSLSNVLAYATTEVLVEILRRAGDDLTRANIRDIARNIDVQPEMYIDGVRYTVTPQDLDPIKTFQMIRFDGLQWQSFGAPISSSK